MIHTPNCFILPCSFYEISVGYCNGNICTYLPCTLATILCPLKAHDCNHSKCNVCVCLHVVVSLTMLLRQHPVLPCISTPSIFQVHNFFTCNWSASHLFLPYAADIAVDWINDKLYWADLNGPIEVMDIATGSKREKTEVIKFSGFTVILGIAVDPNSRSAYTVIILCHYYRRGLRMIVLVYIISLIVLPRRLFVPTVFRMMHT